jgi:hypothetical protein
MEKKSSNNLLLKNTINYKEAIKQRARGGRDEKRNYITEKRDIKKRNGWKR